MQIPIPTPVYERPAESQREHYSNDIAQHDDPARRLRERGQFVSNGPPPFCDPPPGQNHFLEFQKAVLAEPELPETLRRRIGYSLPRPLFPSTLLARRRTNII